MANGTIKPSFKVTELLAERVISNQSNYTLNDAVENYDIIILALAVSSGGTRAMNIVEKNMFTNPQNRNTLISYFGAGNYWVSTTVRGSGNKIYTGNSQTGQSSLQPYLSVYGIKL